MAIALPPPITPELAPLTEVQVAGEQALPLDYHGVRILLAGPSIADKLIDPAVLQAVVGAQENISNAVRAIGLLYYQAGYPATLVKYAVMNEQELFIRLVPGRIEALRGPPGLVRYFENLKGRPLTAANLEGDRVLADTLSERAGDDYRPELRPGKGDALTLDLGEPSPKGHKLGAVAGFSNAGNRYGGPYLVDLSLRQSFDTGDELTLAGVSSIRPFDLGGHKSEPYREGDVSYSRVTPFGLFGLQGRYTDFGQRLPDVPGLGEVQLDGTIGFGGVSWLYPLYADFQRRLNLQGRFDRSYETINVQSIDTKLLSELYNSVELDLSGLQRFDFGDDVLEASFAFALRRGLSGEHSTTTPANLDYFLWRPAINLHYSIGLNWGVFGEASAQFGGSSVPQLEQFVIGGPTSLHAFDAGIGVGDRGHSASLGVDWKPSVDTWAADHQLRPKLFVEYGATTLVGLAPGERDGKINLADVGVEVGFDFTRWLNGTVSAAQSIHEHGRDENNPDGLSTKYVFFRLTAKY